MRPRPGILIDTVKILRLVVGACVLVAVTACHDRQAVVGGEAFAALWVQNLVLRVHTKAIPANPDTVEVMATITNTGNDTSYLEYWGGVTDLSVQAHRMPERTDPPVWDSRRRRDPVTGLPLANPPIGGMVELAPGASLEEFGEQFTSKEFLGDSLPEGIYYLTAVLDFTVRPRRYTSEKHEASVYLPGGSVRLQR